jgi:hypothetical protein
MADNHDVLLFGRWRGVGSMEWPHKGIRTDQKAGHQGSAPNPHTIIFAKARRLSDNFCRRVQNRDSRRQRFGGRHGENEGATGLGKHVTGTGDAFLAVPTHDYKLRPGDL